MGNFGPMTIFEVKIGNTQNIFYMMGYNGELKLTFTLDEWAVKVSPPLLLQPSIRRRPPQQPAISVSWLHSGE